MAIVCGTDFSAGAAQAMRAAAAFARAFGERLVLVHVVDLGALAWVAGRLTDPLVEAAGGRLAELAASLAGAGVEIETRSLAGAPDERLAEVARETDATLVVVGVLGHRSAAPWHAGALATRLARAVPAPVLLVADAEPFERCARGERTLRVLVAAAEGPSGEAAAGWLATLRRLGPCDVLLLHVQDPRRPVGAVERLRERLAAPSGPGAAELRVEPMVGWIGDTLSLAAEREGCDLVLVGGAPRSGLSRIRQDSVSEGLLRGAPSSVLRVPVDAAQGRRPAAPPPPPRLRTLLATTDLSALSNEGVRYACALAPRGATVVLLHVVESEPVPNPLYAHYGRRPAPPERAARAREAEAALRALVPADADARSLEVRIEIEEGDPAQAIRTMAERVDADLVCLATHGRSGLSRLLGGSVAQALAAACERPLLLVRPAPGA